MKRTSVVALVLLAFLLVVLIGSWVYVANFPWPGFGDDKAAEDDSERYRKPLPRTLDDFPEPPSSDDSDAGSGTRGPLELEEADIERMNPPGSVGTGGKGSEGIEVEKGGDSIEAVQVAGLPRVSAGGGAEGDVQEFIVTTLPVPDEKTRELLEKAAEKADRRFENLPSSVTSSSDVPGFSQALTGQIVWPELSEAELDEIKKQGRDRVTVYPERMPEFAAVLYHPARSFVLPATSEMIKQFRARGLKLVVHSPAFQISGGYESIVCKSEDGSIRIELEPAPVFELVVNVTPAEAAMSNVRVWVERRVDPAMPDADDCLYMSARVPSSGRLHFVIPQHYGDLMFGATGPGWHSGLTQRASSWGFKKSRLKLTVTLELAADSCDLTSGRVEVRDIASNVARLECTHFGTVVYSGEDGQFSMYVPFERSAATRQYVVTRPGCRPEVVALEARGTHSAGVAGYPLSGGCTVTLARTVEVRLDIAKDAIPESDWVYLSGSETRIVENRKAVKDVTVTLTWGQNLLYFTENESNKVIGLGYISPSEWDQAFQRYAAGSDRFNVLDVDSAERHFSKR